MPINGMSLMKGATSITVVGGTATTYATDGLRVGNGIHVVDSSVSDLTMVPHATFKNKPHAIQSDGTYSKGRRDFNFSLPIVLSTGAKSYQVFRGTFEFHPEASAATILEMRLLACQMIMDAELDAYHKYGATV